MSAMAKAQRIAHSVGQNFVFVFAHLRWKLKWAFLIACCPPSVSLLHFYIFDFFSRTADRDSELLTS
jgi:hypothetical protein